MTAPAVRRLAGTAEAAGQGRDFARQVLAGSACRDAADLVVTELVANAAAYTRSGLPGGWVEVSITPEPGGALIEVRDQGAVGRAAPGRAPGDADEHGRGLVLVAALAAEWGTRPAGRGRVTWCRLATGTGCRAHDAHIAYGAHDAHA
jgi:anti-sigma regulatory factor (Ser/Thr protein kinase)